MLKEKHFVKCFIVKLVITAAIAYQNPFTSVL